MATVTINVAFGENGLIEKAKLAKKMAENSTAAEQEGMNSLLGEYENIMGTPGEGGGSGTSSNVEELQNTIKDLNNQIEELKKKEAIGDATEADVVSGKTFSSSLGTGLIGAMPTYASGSTAITTAGRWGFDTTYGPWAYIPNDGYYKKAHWINIPWNTVKGNLGDAAASNVLSGKTFTSSNGVKIGGSMPNRGQLNWSGSNTTYSVPAGYYSGGTLDSRASYNAGVTAGRNQEKSTAFNSKSVNSSSKTELDGYITRSIFNTGVTGKTYGTNIFVFPTSVTNSQRSGSTKIPWKCTYNSSNGQIIIDVGPSGENWWSGINTITVFYK